MSTPTPPSDLRVRDVTERDLDAVLTIRNRSFGPLGIGGADWWSRVSAETLGGRMLAVVDGADTVLGAGRIRPFEQVWGGRSVPMGGVAGVYVEPSARGRGVASLLTRGLIERMGELGDVVSCLFPTTATLYRGSGYEVGGVQSRVRYAAHTLRDLRVHSGGRRPRPAGADDADTLQALGRSAARRHRQSGPMVPSTEAWRRELDAGDLITYLLDDGFVSYSLEGDSLTVEHLVAGSPESAAALWGVVGSGSSAAPTVQTYLDPRDPILLGLGGLPATEVRHVPWMARVVDLGAAFASRGFSSALSVAARLAVTDPIAPANDGLWQLGVEAGRPTAVRGAAGGGVGAGATPTGEAAARVEARGLSALWCGWTMSRLRQAGLATDGSDADDAALDAIFACTPYLTEYY